MSSSPPVDVALIGGGIMSATLGIILQRLEPDWRIEVFERLGEVAAESSNPWNNAGTGHSALCELNYMPQRPDGTVEASKAVSINEQFQVSRQFWAYLVNAGDLPEPRKFINATPHMTFVHGEANVEYLRKRFEVLKNEPLFDGIEYSEDLATIAEWTPLIAHGRMTDQKVAATRVVAGTDVDYGAQTRFLFDSLRERGATLSVNQRVDDLTRRPDGTWRLKLRHTVGSTPHDVDARFVFVGAGGGALALLQHAGIPEIKGFGGFPISGQFLRTRKPEVVAEHHAKVYGKAASGAPPMSVPHLDTRVVDGVPALMFGPFAGFTPKFLKTGSWFDLFASIRPHNLIPMIQVALKNFGLLKYLIGEVLATRSAKVKALQEFVPSANGDDWELITAGQRVQVMKKDPEKGGVLQFGTELVTGGDGTIAGLLGASPGASVATSIMLDLISRCFPDKMAEWEPKLREMIPSYGTTLSADPDVARASVAQTAAVLEIPV